MVLNDCSHLFEFQANQLFSEVLFGGIFCNFFHIILLSVHLKGPSTLSAHKKTKQSVDTELIVSQTYSPQESVASFKFEFVSQNALL